MLLHLGFLVSCALASAVGDRIEERASFSPSTRLLGHACRPIVQGVAVRTDWLNGEYDDCILPNVNSITVEYEMTMTFTQPIQGKFTWERCDKIYKYAQDHKLNFRGQSIMYWMTTPDWLKNLNKQEMAKAIYDHSYAIVKRYGEGMKSIVVVNEPMATDGSSNLQDWAGYRTLGIDYIAQAFRGARAANPKVKLILNEYQVEGSYLSNGNSNKRDGFHKLIKDLLAIGVPIDVIGLQNHFEVGKVPKDLVAGMKLFSDLNLDVMVTEVDIRVKNNATWKDYEQQANDYGFIYKTCMMNKRCTAIESWNFNDDLSWIPATFHDYGSATIFGHQCTPKPWILKNVISALSTCPK